MTRIGDGLIASQVYERFCGRRAVPSTVIAAMRYEASERVLTIVFRGSRGRYRYFDVPPEEWDAFRNAPSKGTYLNETFKQKGYRYEKAIRSDHR